MLAIRFFSTQYFCQVYNHIYPTEGFNSFLENANQLTY